MRKGLIIAGISILGIIGGGLVYMDRKNGPSFTNMLLDLRVKTMALIALAKAHGLDVMFFEGWRSPEASALNIKKGTSQLTDPYNTAHLWGVAVDIVFKDVHGNPLWPDINSDLWTKLIELGKLVGLEHPLSWDGPHFQLPGFSIAEIRAEYGEDYISFLNDMGVEYNA